MKKQCSPRVITLVLAVTFVGTNSWAQVDPAWLRSWNEAKEQQPEPITSSGRIALDDEPGTRLVIRGLVVGPDGKSASGVLIHAYHRDRDGLEFGSQDNPLTTWRLNGWARTDADGRFEFQTIRPAPDNLGREAAHIHFTLESADFGRQWAPKVFLADDPLVTARERRRSEKAGEFGWVRDPRIENGVQYVDVRFRLKERADF
ncbi:MAG: hypothetical protein HKN13_15485 [Rhodothermales bacterium]|nr:hypothetical protein [Rhodothermales bacterium]